MDTTTYTDQQMKKLKEELFSAALANDEALVTLASLLHKVFYGVVERPTGPRPIYQEFGFETFDQFAETSRRDGGLDMHQTRARRLVDMYEELFIKWDVDKSTLPKAVTKLFQLTTVAKHAKDVGTMKRWIGKAHAMTCCEFEEAVDVEFKGGKKLRSIRFGFKPTQAIQFQRKLAHARDVLGGNTKGETMLAVLDEWMKQNQDTTRTKRTG